MVDKKKTHLLLHSYKCNSWKTIALITHKNKKQKTSPIKISGDTNPSLEVLSHLNPVKMMIMTGSLYSGDIQKNKESIQKRIQEKKNAIQHILQDTSPKNHELKTNTMSLLAYCARELATRADIWGMIQESKDAIKNILKDPSPQNQRIKTKTVELLVHLSSNNSEVKAAIGGIIKLEKNATQGILKYPSKQYCILNAWASNLFLELAMKPATRAGIEGIIQQEKTAIQGILKDPSPQNQRIKTRVLNLLGQLSLAPDARARIWRIIQQEQDAILGILKLPFCQENNILKRLVIALLIKLSCEANNKGEILKFIQKEPATIEYMLKDPSPQNRKFALGFFRSLAWVDESGAMNKVVEKGK